MPLLLHLVFPQTLVVKKFVEKLPSNLMVVGTVQGCVPGYSLSYEQADSVYPQVGCKIATTSIGVGLDDPYDPKFVDS